MLGSNNHQPLFSLIIVNYNTKKLVVDCLQSLFRHCPHHLFEVIVVDNNSSDGSVVGLREKFGEQVSVIANEHNLGFGRANNLATKNASGELLFFLNSDTLVTDDILSPLAKMMSTHEKLGIISPRLLLPSGQNQPYCFGGFKWPLQKSCRQTNDLAVDERVDYWPIGWVSGAALVMRRELFVKLHGYDPHYFMYYEDLDLCYRARQSGYEVAVCPQVKLIHLGGKSSALRLRKKYYYRSQTYFYHQHCGWLIAWLLQVIRWPWELYYHYR